jgi:hypothetical protein
MEGKQASKQARQGKAADQATSNMHAAPALSLALSLSLLYSFTLIV